MAVNNRDKIYLVIILALILGILIPIGVKNYLTSGFMNKKHHEPPVLKWDSEKDYEIVVYSRVTAFNHKESRKAFVEKSQQWASKNNWNLNVTDNSAVFIPEILNKVDLVILNCVTGDHMTDDQKKSIKEYLEAGGKILGLHATGDGSLGTWFSDSLLFARFAGHPMPNVRPCTITQTNLLEKDSTFGLASSEIPKELKLEDEIYFFHDYPVNFGAKILYTVDEKGLVDEGKWAMGYHPIIWYNEIGDGLLFYSGLGHTAEVYDQPQYQKLLLKVMEKLLVKSH